MASILLLALFQYGNAPRKDGLPVQAPFSLTIATAETSVSKGAKIPVIVTIKNTSDHDMQHVSSLGPGATIGSSTIMVMVRNRKGDVMPELPLSRKAHGRDPQRYPRGGSVFSARTLLKPGETTKEVRTINEEFDMSNPDTYEVRAQDRDPMTGVVVESNSIVITVTP